MCKQSGSTNTQTVVQNPTIPDWLSSKFQNLATRAEEVSNTPFNPAVQKNVADFAPDQLQAFQQVRNDQGIYQPYMDAATGYAAIGGSPVSGQSIQNYMNPFQQNVIDATLGNIQQNNAIQAANLRGNIAVQNGLGNDRGGLMQAELARNQNLATNQTLATLQAQNYNQALGAAQQDRSAAQTAATQFGNLGGNLQSMANRDAASLLQTGGLQQQLAQTQLDTTTQNVAQQQQYPFATASWLGGMLQGASPSFQGSTQTVSQPAPSTLSQIAGLGMLGAGIFGPSDERLKENIEPIGQDNAGRTLYRFNFKGDPETQIGYLAQEIAESDPDAVMVGDDGFLRVDYKDVTDDAVMGQAEAAPQEMREGFNDGGLTVPGNWTQARYKQPQGAGTMTPYGIDNTVPQAAIQSGSMLAASPIKKMQPPAPTRARTMVEEAKDLADDFTGMKKAGEGLGSMASEAYGQMTKGEGEWGATTRPTAGGFGNMFRNSIGMADGGNVYGPAAEMIPGQPTYAGAPTPYGQSAIVPPAPQPAMRPSGLGAVAPAPAAPAPAPAAPPSGLGVGQPDVSAGQTAGGAVGAQTAGGLGGMFNMSDAVRAGLVQAGFATLAGQSPNALTNIGRGGAVGFSGYQQAKAMEDAKARQAADEAHRNKLLEMRIAEFKAEQKIREAEAARRAAREPYELDALRRQAAEPGFAERQRIEADERLRLERDKYASAEQRLRARARALGLETGEGAAPSTTSPSSRPAQPEAGAPVPYGTPIAAGPSNDAYGRLTTPSVDKAREEADRKRRAAQALALGDEKAAIKILNKEEDPKEYQVKDAAWAERMARAEIAMRGVTGDIDPDQGPQQYNPGARSNALWFDNSMFNSSDWKQFQGAAREWIAALLRKDTGAAVTQDEWNLYFPTYFPVPGDGPEEQKAKLERRIETARGLRASAGPAFERQNPNFDREMKQRITDQNGGPPKVVQPPLAAIDDLRKNRNNPALMKAFAEKYGVDPRNYLMD